MFSTVLKVSLIPSFFFSIDMKWERQMWKGCTMNMLLKEKGHAVAHLLTWLRSKPLIDVGGIHSLLLWGGGKCIGARIISRSSFQWVFWRRESLLLGEVICRLLIVDYWPLVFSCCKTVVLGDRTGVHPFHFAWVWRIKCILQFLNDTKKCAVVKIWCRACNSHVFLDAALSAGLQLQHLTPCEKLCFQWNIQFHYGTIGGTQWRGVGTGDRNSASSFAFFLRRVTPLIFFCLVCNIK